ncbi:zinc finger protein 638-like isoform X2 [Narcine bancroftii]|uniref:zinc finger protein 638-like isoform X2 n=1 Tax=Narcine bancroftii TaxID=1343680 RepID=UPI0038313230
MAVAAQAQLGAYPSAGSAIDCGACVTAAVASAAAAFDSEPLRGRQRPEERVRRERGVVVSAGGVGGSFALFLENCAPAVNSLNLGITSPLLLGSANLQLAQIKAQLALQQLNSVASSTVSNTALASLNQALVKINMSMFNARGAFGQSRGPPNQYGQSQGPPNQYGQSQGPVNQYGLSQGPANQYGQSQGPPSQYGQSQGPPSQYGQSQCPPSQFGQSQGPPSQFGQSQGPPSHFGKTQVPPNQFQNQGPPNQFAMNTPGPYMGGGVGGTGRGMGMGAQGTSQGNFGMGMGMMNQPGSNVGLGQWSSYQSPSSGGYRPGYGNTATPSSQSGEQRSAVQLFHDTMKATNILANFGLSNEDLEELSRYPDEKLTPENMPYILREIRMRKMNKQQASSSYDQAHKLQDKDYRREVQSSVVDYGHGQQYDYRDRPMENQSMHYSRETLREGTWKEDFKRPPQNYPLESSRDESTHTIKRTVQVVKKGLPKPKLMNDYYGVPALRFPHVCSLCNIECRQMRDWDRHNKTSVHNDSCRLLLKEYPDWDPDAVPPTKEELAKKEKEAAAAGQATPSFSTARISPKHLSPRRMSPHRTSPRRSSPHKPSPRHLSPRKNSPRRFSPHRSRSSPRRSSPYRSRSSPRHASPYRSRSSPRRMSPHRSRPRRLSPHKSRSSPPKSSPRKPNPKHKSQKEMPAKNSNQKAPVSQLTNQKPPNQKIMKQPAKTSKSFAEAKRNAGPAASSALAEKPAAQQEANAQQMNEMRKSERVVRVTDLPHDGYTEEDLSKLTQPFGKVTSIKLVRSKNEAFLKMAYKEAAEAVVEFYSITPAEINRRQVTMMLLGQKKEMVKQDQKEQLPSQAAPSVQKDKDTSDTNAKPPATSEDATPATDAKMSGDESSSVHKPQSEDDSLNDKGRVIRISNLPAKGYTEDDLKSLAKPFGQVLNVVITFSRNQAYLEMACTKAATKMVEFYSLSTIKLKGNAISMEILHQYLDLSDMEVIFKDIIEESGFKPDAGCTIYDHLVHISNLPEDGYTEVDILWVAFRFGRVKDSMFLKPHNKVLIHLESGNAATSMCSFFREIPHDFHGKTLEFSLSPHAGIQPENEGKKEQQSEESCDPGTEPEPMEMQPARDAESKEVEMTDVTEEKAQETLSDQTQSNPSAAATSATVEETAGTSVAGATVQSLVPATVNEPPVAVNPSVASTAATPPVTKSPAPLDVIVPTPSHSTPIGKAAPAGRNAPSKGAAVAINAADKPTAVCEKSVAPTTGSVTKPTPAACSETSPSVAASVASKPPSGAESPPLQPAMVSGKLGEESAQPAGQPTPAPGSDASPTDGTVASSPTVSLPANPTAGDPAVEKSSLGPAATPPAETHADDEAAAPAASPTLGPSKTSTPNSPSTARPLKSMVVKLSGKESAATKPCEKKGAPPRKEHVARETGKAGTPARGRSTSKERFSREGSGRSSSSHQRERERERERDYRSDRRHMTQYQRDKEYRLYSKSKMYYERSNRGRRGSNRSRPKREEQGVFPFNLDEFVTVDEVGEEEDSAGEQIPETESNTNIQASDNTETETTEAEAAEETQSPESAAGDGSKGTETTEVKPEAEPQPEVGAQPEPQPEAKEEPMETEATQEKSAEAPTPESSEAPVSDTKPEVTATSAAVTAAVKGEAAAAMAGSGEPSSTTTVPPPSNPVLATSKGDAARPTGTEQQTDPKLKREAAPEVEPAVKRIKLAGTALAELKMPPYKPNSPIGVEFIVPKTGYFCQICSLFYTNEDTAKVTHCGTVLHYKNMEKYVTQRQAEMRRQQERVVKPHK